MNFSPAPKKYVLTLAVACVGFVAWALFLFGRVGAFSPDEVMVVIRAVEGVCEISRGDWSIFSPREWMVLLYAGNLKILAMLPVFAVFAPSVEVMHVVWALFASVSVWLVFAVVGWLRSWFEAIVSSLLMCVNYYYVSSAVVAADLEEVFIIGVFWAALFAALLYVRRHQLVWAVCCGLLLGVGVWIKIMFFAYLAGLFCVLLLWRKAVAKKIMPSGWVGCVCGFLLGSLPYWIGSVVAKSTLWDLAQNAFSSGAGTDNSDVLGNLLLRCRHLWLVSTSTFQFGFTTLENLPDVGFAVLVLAAAVFFVRRRGKNDSALFRAGLVFCAVVFCLSVFVPSRHDPSHLFILIPFFQMLCAGLIYELKSGKYRLAQAVAVLLLLSHVFVQVSMFWYAGREVKRLNATGLRDYDLVFDYFKGNGATESLWLLPETFFCSVRFGQMTRKIVSHMPFGADTGEFVSDNVRSDWFYLVDGVPGSDMDGIKKQLKRRGFDVRFEKFWKQSNSGCLLNIYRVSADKR